MIRSQPVLAAGPGLPVTGSPGPGRRPERECGART